MKKIFSLILVLVMVASLTARDTSAALDRALSRLLNNFGYSGYYTAEQGIDILIDSNGHINFIIADSIEVTSALHFTDAATIYTTVGSLEIADDVVVDSTLTVTGNVDLNGDADVDGTANLDNTDIDGTLAVDGTTIDLNPTSALTIDGALTNIGGGSGQTADGDNDLLVAGDLEVDTNCDFDGNIDVEGTANLDNTDIDGTLAVDGTTIDLNPTSALTIDGALTNIGGGTGATADGDNDVLIAGDLEVDTNCDFDGNIDVDGTANLDEVDVDGAVQIDSTVSIGGWGYTGEHIVIGESSSNTNAGLGLYGMANYAIAAGKVLAGTYSRMLAMTENQANLATMVGMESQFRLRDVDVANGVHAGLWAYAEQSGTSTLSGGGTFDAISATVESESGFAAGATEHITGITLDSSINGSATINASANFAAVYIKSNGKDWYDGIKITGCTNDIELQHGENIDNATDGVINMGAAQLQIQTVNFVNIGGTADVLTADFTPDLAALVAGLTIEFVADSANTGAVTLQIDGGDVKNVYEASDISALDANDIRAGMYVVLKYDGTQWQQVSQSGN